MRATRAVLIAALLVSLAACARSSESIHPRGTLARYVQHVRANNPQGAYRLLARKVKDLQSYEAFERAWKNHYPDLQAQAAEIEANLKREKSYRLSAKAKVGGQREVSLVWEKQRWRVAGGVSAGFDATSPREAVLALVHALEGRSFSAFLRVLTQQRRDGLSRELTQRLEKLKANLDRAFEVTGNRARLQYDPKHWIMLVKENGAWKVLEFN